MNEAVHPTRIIVRAMTEFMLRAVRANAAPHGGEMLQTVMFSTIRNASLDPIARSELEARRAFEALERLTDDQLRPVSINAVAQSFGVPYETARGAVGRLARRGYCLKVAGGVIVPVQALLRPEIAEAEHTVAALLDEAMGRLAVVGLDFDQIARMGGMEAAPAREAEPGPLPPRQLSWIGTSFLISTVENMVLTFGDFTASFVFAGVMDANAKAITHDAALAWTYPHVDTPPPDEARRPVSIRALAEMIGMPFETVRRHANRLVDHGDLIRVEEGLLVSNEVMQTERILRNAGVAVLRFARMVADLRRAGYVFERSDKAVEADGRAVRRGGSA